MAFVVLYTVAGTKLPEPGAGVFRPGGVVVKAVGFVGVVERFKTGDEIEPQQHQQKHGYAPFAKPVGDSPNHSREHAGQNKQAGAGRNAEGRVVNQIAQHQEQYHADELQHQSVEVVLLEDAAENPRVVVGYRADKAGPEGFVEIVVHPPSAGILLDILQVYRAPARCIGTRHVGWLFLPSYVVGNIAVGKLKI